MNARRTPLLLSLLAIALVTLGGLYLCSAAQAAVPSPEELTGEQAVEYVKLAFRILELIIYGLSGLAAIAVPLWFRIQAQIKKQREAHDVKLEMQAGKIEALEAKVERRAE